MNINDYYYSGPSRLGYLLLLENYNTCGTFFLKVYYFLKLS